MIIYNKARKKARKKENQLVRITSSLIHFNDRCIQAINNADINMAKNLGLMNIKNTRNMLIKLKKKVNRLYRDQISAFTIFMIYLRLIYNNQKKY